MFETLEKHSTYGEEHLILEVVKALDGNRTRFQTKGRFRNLLASGKIRASDTVPQQWIVMPGNFGKRARAREERERLRSTVITTSPSDGDGETGPGSDAKQHDGTDDDEVMDSKLDEDDDETDNEHKEKFDGGDSEDSYHSNGSEDGA